MGSQWTPAALWRHMERVAFASVLLNCLGVGLQVIRPYFGRELV